MNIRVDVWPDRVPIDTSQSNVTSVVVAGTGLSDKEELPCVNSCS